MNLPYVRWTLTIFLLAVVAHHTHWSVTLCFSLIAAAIEIQGMTIYSVLQKQKAVDEFSERVEEQDGL